MLNISSVERVHWRFKGQRVRFTMRLRMSLYDRLKERAEKSGASINDLVEEAIEKMINEKKN